MRTPLLLLACPALAVLPSCDGALGGNIHDQPEEVTAASLERDRREPTTRSVVDLPDPPPSSEEPESPEVDEPEEVEVADAPEPTPPPPPPKASGGGGGGRGRGRGGSGSHSGAITLLDAGAAAAGTLGRVSGTVLFEGTPPIPKQLEQIAATEGCHAHGETPVSEEVVVNDGRFQNVFVYLKSIPDGVDIPPPPAEPLVLDQVGCMYVPHVAGIQAGRPLHAANSDDASHNVRMSTSRNKGDNKTIAAGSPPLQLPTPEREEVPMEFACDIHPWMSAKVCVVEHPWFDVSAADGTFTIEGIPPGTYKIEAWQEKYGKAKVSGDVVVGPGGHVQVDFTYKP